MRLLPMILGYIFSAVVVWLTDSVIVSLFQDILFKDALWTLVAPGRLLVRLFIVAVILILCTVKVIRNTSINNVYRVNCVGVDYGTNCCAESTNKSQRLIFHAKKLATALKLNNRQKTKLFLLCKYYDIGFISVNRDIINRRNSLSAEEQKIYDSHTYLGAEIAEAIPQLAYISYLIKYHEECFDGSGIYGLFARKIPIECRVFQVVLMYDNFTHPDALGKKMLSEEALNELGYYAGSVLDPEIVWVFNKVMGYKGLENSISESVSIFR